MVESRVEHGIIELKVLIRDDKRSFNCLLGSAEINSRSFVGKYYFLNLYGVSSFEWHPFSVSGYDEKKGIITFHIKCQVLIDVRILRCYLIIFLIFKVNY